MNIPVKQLNPASKRVLLEWIPQSVPAQEVDPSSDIGTQCTPRTELMHVEQGNLKEQFISMVINNLLGKYWVMLRNESKLQCNLELGD